MSIKYETNEKILCGFMTILMVLTLITPVYAADVSSDGGNGTVPIELTAEVTTFSVTVPTSLTINVSTTGEVTVRKINKIINKRQR